MGFNKFEDIIVWQKSQEFAAKIYLELNKSTHYAFKDQINKAAISISNNIAEGFSRNTPNNFKQFLSYAQGSNAEVRSMLHLSIKLKSIEENIAKELIRESNSIGKMITKLKSKIK